jgi:hypothetical protein
MIKEQDKGIKDKEKTMQSPGWSPQMFGRLRFWLKPLSCNLYPSHKWDGNELKSLKHFVSIIAVGFSQNQPFVFIASLLNTCRGLKEIFQFLLVFYLFVFYPSSTFDF